MITIPTMTDAYNDLTSSVTFISSGRGQVNLSTVVYFSPPVGPLSPSVNAYTGSALGIAINAMGTMVTITVGASGGFISGIQSSGQTDGTYYLTVNNVIFGTFTTNFFDEQINYTSPGRITVMAGDVVRLYVQNIGQQTADFNGSIFGIF